MLRLLHSRADRRTDWDSVLGRQLLDGTEDVSAGDVGSLFVELGDRKAWREFCRDHAAAFRKRRALERFLAWSQEPFTISGFNALIEKPVLFAVDYLYSAEPVDGFRLPNWRERVVCPETGLINRIRGTLLAISHLLRPRQLAKVRVYATEQVTPFFTWLRQVNPSVIGSEYLGPAVPPGGSRDGIRNEDLTRLSFADASFDLVVTNDVLEHVPTYAEAYRELFRVLAPGGLLVFTVPFDLSCDEHLIRARVNAAGEVEHLLPPEYHGDPVNSQDGVLCYQVFGWKMMKELRDVGFSRTGALTYWSLVHGLLGPDQCVFFAVKPVAGQSRR